MSLCKERLGLACLCWKRLIGTLLLHTLHTAIHFSCSISHHKLVFIRLKEEIATLQEEKENAEEKVHSQGLKLRRLMEENLQRKEGKDPGGRDSPTGLSRSESLNSIESEDGGIHY